MDSAPHRLRPKGEQTEHDAPFLPDDVLALIAISGDISLFATMALCSRALHSKLRSPHFIALARQRLLREVGVDHHRWHLNKADKVHGIEEWLWADSGMCAIRLYWRDGRQHGTSETWNAAGVRTHLSHWCEGKRHGSAEEWKSAAGQLGGVERRG